MKRLKLFGGVSIETDQGPLTGRAAQRRRLALLSLLAASLPRGMSRDRVIAYLWPDADADSGRRFLSDSVYRINDALSGDVIIAAGDELRLDAERLPSDLSDFTDARARGDHEAAAREYHGPFLDGFFLSDAPEFEHWADAERARLSREYAGVLEALAEARAQQGDMAAAASWWRTLAAHDPYNSRIALRLMQALDAIGERAAAIQHARIFEALLADEMEIEPDPAVKKLAEQLRADTRFVAPATPEVERERPIEPVVEPPQVHNDAPHQPPARRKWLIAAFVIVLAAGGVLATQRNWVQVHDTSNRVNSIAVLPFANLSGQPENEYFSDGITEELISDLGKINGLQVASRSSVFALKNKSLDVHEAGRRLGVSTVLEGSVRKSGNQLRITVQLVNTEKGYALWSEAYDRELKDVFSIQEEISRSIVQALTGALTGNDPAPFIARSTTDAGAYDLYLKGRFAWHQRTRDGLVRAVAYFDSATSRAPTYARAYVGLADAYAVSAFYDYLRPREAYPRAEAAAMRALELDPTMAAPHATLGYVYTYYDLDWKRAESEFKRAIEMDPSYSTAHQWYANLLIASARFDEAEQELRLAQEADPLSLIANAALGFSMYFAGKPAAALEQCRQVLTLNPDFELAHLWGGWALDEMGRSSEAIEWTKNAVRLSHGSALTRLALARSLARSGNYSRSDSARAILGDIEAQGSRGEYVPSYEIGKVHLALGEKDEALKWLVRAVDERSHSRAFFDVDPQLASLRGDPRFQALSVRDTKPASRR
ncbi:MAG: tetratricopeptide repeat protein [bacterium]